MKIKNLKYRLILILIFISIIGCVAYKFNKPIDIKVNEKESYYSDKTITSELVQNIKVAYNKPQNITFSWENYLTGIITMLK